MTDQTNAEVLGKALLDFENLEYEDQKYIASFIECCNSPVCLFDGKDVSLCLPCKIEWLMKKWED